MKKILYFLLMLILSFTLAFLIAINLNLIHIEFINPIKKNADDYINNGLKLDDENLSNSNGTEDRFYYNQLSDIAKIIYDKLIDEKDKLKTGTAEIYFLENEFDSLLDKNNGMTVLSEEYQNAADAIRYDNVDLFYIDFTKMALKTITYTRGRDRSYTVYLAPLEENGDYLQDDATKDEVDDMLLAIEEKTATILENANGSNYQKIQYIHNWLIDNVKYDSTYIKENNRNIYGTLINGEVVCEGYAKTFKYLMDKLEIPCIIVSGEAVNSEGTSENHMWNYVKINNVWYSVDVTWDDPILLNDGTLTDEYRYKYFCQGDNINSNHYLTHTITDDGQEYELPELYHKE